MPLWKTDEIVKLCTFPGVTVEVFEPGGDFDTREVYVTFPHEPDDGLIVYGMSDYHQSNHPGLSDKERDELELRDVVLRNRMSDSDGGIQTQDAKILLTGTTIRAELTLLGFIVHDHWKKI